MKSKVLLPLVLVLFAVKTVNPARAESVSDAQLKRGQYLVEGVAVCADCHTARDWKGTPDREHWLQGSKLDFKPIKIMPWAAVAPPIAGLPAFAADEPAVKYFETGLNSKGKESSPPMPQFRLDHDDAAAVVAYLRSLKPQPKTKGGG
jgi:mono/diheme cytochrome c family protein